MISRLIQQIKHKENSDDGPTDAVRRETDSRGISQLENRRSITSTKQTTNITEHVDNVLSLKTPQDVKPKIITNRFRRNEVGHTTPVISEQQNNSLGVDKQKPTKQDRNTRVEILDYRKLRSYEYNDSASLLLKICHDQSGLSELLNLPCFSPDMVQLTLSVLAKACKCYSAPQSLSNLLIKFQNSKFFTVKIPEVLIDLTVSQIDEKNARKTILNICVIIETLLVVIPHSCLNVSGTITMVTEVVDKLVSSSKNIDDEVVRASTDLQKIHNFKYEQMKIQKQKKYNNATDSAEAEPPDDFRDIPIIPTMKDVTTQPFLRKNKVNSAYKNLDQYLDVHFRLLREDFIHPLREGIGEYLAAIENDEPTEVQKFENFQLYTDVTVEGPVCYRTDLLHRLHFDSTKLKHVDWKMSKRLIYGSLVCLSPDNFQTFYLATVTDRDPKYLTNGYIDVRFEHDLEEIFAISTNQHFVMMETSAYFEAYKHVLKGLQKVQTLPFAQYLVEMQTEVAPPKYLLNNSVFNMEPLMCNSDDQSHTSPSIDILDPLSWPSAELFTLNDSQYAAFKTALTKEFSIIQGPPGTGKTYLGLKVAKALLHNCQKWNNGPILIVCYTNHALDQFLEGISKVFDGKIVRVGGRSSSEIINKYSLKEWKEIAKVQKLYRDLAHLNYLRFGELEYLEETIAFTLRRVQVIKYGTYILNEDELRQAIARRHYAQLAMSKESRAFSLILEWLGIGVNSDIMKAMTNSKKQTTDEVETADEKMDTIAVPDDWFDKVVDKSKSVEFYLSLMNNMQSNDGFVLPKQSRQKFKKRLQQYLKSKDMMTQEEVDNVNDVWQLNNRTRWRLYKYWVSQHCQKLKNQIIDDCKQYQEAGEAIKEVNFQRDQKIMADAKVIAMTTTGAARYQSILEEISPRIIIVEEAAEVLEAHIITAITKGCEQLILIGDHKQLRPNPNVFELAARYNLDISLFERMINSGVQCDCLQIQHRMRPEISRLMKPIYPSLQDHHSVTQFEQIDGISSNVFFINHGQLEEPDDDENRSHSNLYEAEYVFRFTDYLLKQGYPRNQITILTTYSGQLKELNKMVRKSPVEGIRITTVDNFQGEESDIIVLSLVRSSENHKIGFLKAENRICVALSRARKGLYVIGNFDIFASQSTVWKKLTLILKQTNEIGSTLTLRCQNHPQNVGIDVNTPNDFCLAPEGGCQIPCMTRLDCGHSCAKMCHPLDPNHEEYRCLQPCTKICNAGHPCNRRCFKECDCPVLVEKTMPFCGHIDMVECYKPAEEHNCTKPCSSLCKAGHPCSLRCYEDCNNCQVLVEKTMPICGHINMVECYKPAKEHKCIKPCSSLCNAGHPCNRRCFEECDCPVLVEKTMPVCGHSVMIECYKSPDPRQCKAVIQKTWECKHHGNVLCNQSLTSECKQPCGKTLECGHLCIGDCSLCLKGRIHRPCNLKCTKILVCDHKCTSTCFNCLPCKIPCNNKCTHGRCTKTCGEVCVKCTEPCDWRCEHFKCTKRCHEPCDRPTCDMPCPEKLLCGHKCIGLCGEPCPTLCQICNKEEASEIFFGTEEEQGARFVQLPDCGHIFEYKGLDNCMNENTSESSTNVIQMKVCPKCKTAIRRCVRYGSIINRINENINDVKQKLVGVPGIKEKMIEENERILSTIEENMEKKKTRTDWTFNQVFTKRNNAATTEHVLFVIGQQLRFFEKYLALYFRLKTFKESVPSAKYMSDQLFDLLHWIVQKRHILTRQEINDVQTELQRLSLIINLHQKEIAIAEKGLAVPDDIKETVHKSKKLFKEGFPISGGCKKDIDRVFKEMDKLAPEAHLEIIEDERIEIVNTMKFTQGHWIKCKNGHIYSIGDSGGEMGEETCLECKNTAGEDNNRLSGEC